MKTSEKSTKTSPALKAYGDEIKSNFKKQCDECIANRKDADELRESTHAEEYAKLLSQKESDKEHFDKISEQYRKDILSRWMGSKHFRNFIIVVFIAVCAIVGNIVQTVYHVEHYRKMKIYNTVLMYIHDKYPKANIKQHIRVVERPEINQQWHKDIKKQVEKYDDLWWLKE